MHQPSIHLQKRQVLFVPAHKQEGNPARVKEQFATFEQETNKHVKGITGLE
jgi:hypothetical protein